MRFTGRQNRRVMHHAGRLGRSQILDDRVVLRAPAAPRGGSIVRTQLMRLLLVSAIVFGLLPATTSPASAQDPPLEQGLIVLQWNICGQAAHCPQSPEIPPADKQVIAEVVDRIVNVEADFVTLQEVCRTQYDRIVQLLQERGHPMESSFSVTTTGVDERCGGPAGTAAGFGNAVLSRWPGLGGPAVDETLTPGGHPAKLLCQVFRVTRSDARRFVYVCTTHLSTDPGQATQQAARAAVIMNEYIDAAYPVVFTGDLNVRPDHAALDPIYSHNGGTGKFQEIDENYDDIFMGCGWFEDPPCRAGRWTHPTFPIPLRKFDYIFLSGSFRVNAALVGRTDTSDHFPLYGGVYVNLEYDDVISPPPPGPGPESIPAGHSQP